MSQEKVRTAVENNDILKCLPYTRPFLFVDVIEEASEDGIVGHYTFREDEFFYEGHFKNNPVTPGVILSECMAQIGVVCLGIYLMRDDLSDSKRPAIALTSYELDFYKPVFPGDTVWVYSEKEKFRFNKLKCNLKMYNKEKELISRGKISGMWRP